MGTILIAVGSFVGYVIAYRTYGRFLASRLFNLDCSRKTAAVECEDGVDFVPTRAQILFGHHYTSIAGTGPIVGPAIGIIWGWVPALIWVLLGSIFMGAVHDFGAIVVSMRNRGRSLGDIASDLVSPRVRMMFLWLVFVTVMIVIAVFCLVIASVFKMFPESVIPIWCEIPIAIALGFLVYRRKWPVVPTAIAAVTLMYLTVWLGAVVNEHVQLVIPQLGPIGPNVSWTVILLVYGYIASVLPVWRLLQPRDFINGYQLFIAMGLLALGIVFAHPQIVAPAWNPHPVNAPPFWALFFVTIACGAISGFHALVGSGTTSKQICQETDACVIGYGSMILEGLLAVFVIIAVAAGIGMATGEGLSGVDAWNAHYMDWSKAQGLGPKLGAFIKGSGNMLSAIGLSVELARAIMAVFVTSFAATTLDTAMRIQRYVVSELASAHRIKPLTGRHAATLFAAITAGALALADGEGKGGLILWPLFGASNQLIACLALFVVTSYLKKQGKAIYYTIIPAFLMFVVTALAMGYNIYTYAAPMFAEEASFGKLHLLLIGILVLGIEIWMIVETLGVVFGRQSGTQTEAATGN